ERACASKASKSSAPSKYREPHGSAFQKSRTSFLSCGLCALAIFEGDLSRIVTQHPHTTSNPAHTYAHPRSRSDVGGDLPSECAHWLSLGRCGQRIRLSPSRSASSFLCVMRRAICRAALNPCAGLAKYTSLIPTAATKLPRSLARLTRP